MECAERLSLERGLPPLDVLVYFWNDEPLEDLERGARSLVEFVRTHPVGDCETFDRFHVPYGFGVVRIARPLANSAPRWKCGETTNGAVLERDFLAAAIRQKNDDLPRYREKCDRAWLLLATTLFPLSADLRLPRDSEQWRFEFDFDKVLLLSEQDGVFSLRRPDQEAL